MVKKGKGGSANGLSPKKQSSTSDQISLADGTKVCYNRDTEVCMSGKCTSEIFTDSTLSGI